MHYFFDENLTRSKRVQRNEQEIFNIIETFIAAYHRPPTIREIAKHSQVNSTSTVTAYLKKLKEKGLINWEPKKGGTLHIVK